MRDIFRCLQVWCSLQVLLNILQFTPLLWFHAEVRAFFSVHTKIGSPFPPVFWSRCSCMLSVSTQKFKMQRLRGGAGPREKCGPGVRRPQMPAQLCQLGQSHSSQPRSPVSLSVSREGWTRQISGSDVYTVATLFLPNLLLILNTSNSEQLLRPLFRLTLLAVCRRTRLLEEKVIRCWLSGSPKS